MRRLSIALTGLFTIFFAAALLMAILVNQNMRTTITQQKNILTQLTNKLRSSSIEENTSRYEIKLIKKTFSTNPLFLGILLYSYTSGIEYLQAKDTKYVLRNNKNEPLLHKKGLFTKKITSSYYKIDGSSFTIEAIVRSIPKQNLLRIMGITSAGGAGAVLILLIFIMGYERINRKYKERFKEVATRHKKKNNDNKKEPLPPPLNSEEKKVAESFSIDTLLRNAYSKEKSRKDSIITAENDNALDETLQAQPQSLLKEDDIKKDSTLFIELRKEKEQQPNIVLMADEDHQNLEKDSESIKEEHTEETQNNTDCKKTPTDNISQIKEREQNNPLLMRLAEEMERCYCFSHELSLALIQLPDICPPDTIKSCWNIMKNLSFIRNTVFHVNTKQIAIIYPNTNIDQTLATARSMYNTCETTLHIKINIGAISLCRRVITPEFFFSEAETALQKALSAEPPIMGFAPDPKEFQRISKEEKIFAFSHLESLPLPPPDFDWEIEDSAFFKSYNEFEKTKQPASSTNELEESSESWEHPVPEYQAASNNINSGKQEMPQNDFWDSLIIK